MARKPKSDAGTPESQAPRTQRAYTLRLRGPDPADTAWRDALWATHEAINAGAKVFGDWLLTLRGGLCHTLVEPLPAGGKTRTEEEAAALRAGRRILLALSWLSVEDARGAPDGERAGEAVRVATGKDTPEVRKDKVLAALRAILTKRGLSAGEIESWMADCSDSLASRIRDDAVWVNRSVCFEAAAADIGPTLTRDEIWDILEPFFASRESYLAPVELADDEDCGGADEKAKDLVQKAGQWLSSRFGTGTGADFSSIARVYAAMAEWAGSARSFDSGSAALADLARALAAFAPSSGDADGLLKLISGPGYKSATRIIIKAWGERNEAVTAEDLAKFGEVTTADEGKASSNVGGKGRRPWSDRVLDSVEQACGFTYLQADGPARHSQFAVMLDHAARRVSIGHSWIKRAEAQRRQFDADARKLASVPAEAARWLDQFIEERGGTAGGDYRIRRRAIEGWDKVVERWSRKDCITADDRIRAARELQDDPEIEKFGDIQLFEALAVDDALIVWRSDGGKPDAQALKDYVQGHDARFRRLHYKVPAYRHPDPLRHPVFGDFGNSRWEIAYAAHEAVKAAGSKRKPDATRAAFLRDGHGLKMTLWNGDAMSETPLRWSSKRLSADLLLDPIDPDAEVAAVTRADRLGRAAAGVGANDAARPSGLFALADWNGRLQAPRAQLDALAQRVDTHGWDRTAKCMRDRVRWLVSFSAKLECRGPFDDFAARFTDTDPAKPFLSRKGERAIKHASNDKRSGHAKLILSRLPGLRVLSVDLGHRFAASCAVWEALPESAFKTEIAGRAIVAGAVDGHFIQTRHTEVRTGTQRTTIYRRIGADTLAHGSPHPAPWARLDRQFLIKLQGEEQPARAASGDEISKVKDFESAIGRHRRDDRYDALPRRVDDLMSEAVRSARLGLRRHADAARIAYAFMPGGLRHKPGGATEEHTPESRLAAVLNALMCWQNLCSQSGARWRDAEARQLWDTHVAPRLSAALPVLADDATGPQRKAHRKWIEELLSPLATDLAQTGIKGQPELHKAWSKKWTADHTRWQQHLKWLSRWLLPRRIRRLKPLSHEGFAKLSQRGREDLVRQLDVADPAVGERLLEQLNTSIHERNSQTGRNRAQARNVGGLSLTRIATMRELWQVQKAFHYGAEPGDLRAGVRRIEGDSARGVKFGQRALDAMERMREQRVKQISSRIAASALGLGGHWKEVVRRDHAGRALLDADGKACTKRVWVEEPDAKYAPCHAVVIENLRNYRPDELQTRRENRALMAWSSAKVAKYLGEACQLHGLHLREVSPNYTSRQCSRTGLPGLRCVDVKVNEETGEPDVYWWKKTLASAEKKAGANGDAGDAESRFIVALSRHLKAIKDSSGTLPRTVRLPRRGGDLFVAAPAWDDLRRDGFRAGAAVQADLNAAANIGLRALLDPDFAGRWWYVPCEAASGRPAKDKCAGSAALDLDKALIEPQSGDADGAKAKQARGKAKDITNAWRDVGRQDGWRQHAPYWNGIAARVMERLRLANGLEDRSTTRPGDDIETPF